MRNQCLFSSFSIIITAFLLIAATPSFPNTVVLELPEHNEVGAIEYTISQLPPRALDTHTEEDLLCLQKNIYWEARNQDPAGKAAVATVTINRVVSPRFPNSVCGVVRQAFTRHGSPVRNRCAFSWYCDGLSDYPRLDNQFEVSAWRLAGEIAREALSGRLTNSEIGTATHYHANYVTPWWSRHDRMTQVGMVGDHIFYEEL